MSQTATNQLTTTITVDETSTTTMQIQFNTIRQYNQNNEHNNNITMSNDDIITIDNDNNNINDDLNTPYIHTILSTPINNSNNKITDNITPIQYNNNISPINTTTNKSQSQTESQTVESFFNNAFNTDNSNRTIKNAFKLLQPQHSAHKRKSINNNTPYSSTQRSSKRSSLTPNSSQSINNEGSRFVSCPICHYEYSIYDIDEHAGNCNGSNNNSENDENNYKTPHNNNKTISKTSSNKLNKSYITHNKTQQRGSAYERCVMCNQDIPLSILSMHINDCANNQAKKLMKSPQSNNIIKNNHKQQINNNNNKIQQRQQQTNQATYATNIKSAQPQPQLQTMSMESQMFDTHEEDTLMSNKQNNDNENVKSADNIPVNQLFNNEQPPNQNKQDNNVNTDTTSTKTTTTITAKTEQTNTTSSSHTKLHPLFTAGAKSATEFNKNIRKNKADKYILSQLIFICDINHQYDLIDHTLGTIDITQPIIYNRSYGLQWYMIQIDKHNEFITDNNNIIVYIDNDTQTAKLVNDQQPNQYDTNNIHTYKQCANINLHQNDTTNISHNNVIQLLCYTSDELINAPHFDINEPRLIFNQVSTQPRIQLSPSLMKSILQKNIRLCNAIAAVRTAMQLIQLHGLTELVRRLFICCIEDSILHPMLPYLCWYTCVLSKQQNIKYSYVHMNTLLQMTYEIANSQIKDNLLNSDHDDNKDNTLDLTSDISDLTISQQCIIRTLLIRSCLGGMKVDMSMLQQYGNLWIKRFRHDNIKQLQGTIKNNKTWINLIHGIYNRARRRVLNDPTGIVLLQVQDIDSMKYDDCVLTAVDHHCSNIIQALLSQYSNVREHIATYIRDNFSDKDGEEVLKDMIWFNRSAINNKQLLRKEDDDDQPITQQQYKDKLRTLYDSITKDVDYMCNRILKYKINKPT